MPDETSTVGKPQVRVGTVLTSHKWLQTPHKTLTDYNSLDCIATARLVPHLKRALLKSGNAAFFLDSFWPMVDVTVAMQRRGVGELDLEARNRYRRQLRREIAELEKAILDGTDRSKFTDKLFNSPEQLAVLLYDEWGLKDPPKTQKRPARSTDLSALAWVLDNLRKKDEPLRPKLHDLFHRSRLQTILERYLVIEGDEDGRVRPTIKLTGTKTLRLAYTGGPGEAIQQWPPECRHLIRAKPGFVFVARDYSQLEARILAVLSNDVPSLVAFREGRDIHSQNASDLFALSGMGDKSRAPEALRNYAKTFLYGISYGGKAESIKMKVFCPCFRCAEKAPEQVNLSRQDVKDAADRWARAHFAILEWRRNLVEEVFGYGRDRTWTSPFKFKRRFWEPQSEGERSLMNFPMQHCASQIVNRAMVRLHALGAPLVLQMHDEIMLEVREKDAELALEQLKCVMEMPVPELSGTVFPTKGGISGTWGGLK